MEIADCQIVQSNHISANGINTGVTIIHDKLLAIYQRVIQYNNILYIYRSTRNVSYSMYLVLYAH